MFHIFGKQDITEETRK